MKEQKNKTEIFWSLGKKDDFVYQVNPVAVYIFLLLKLFLTVTKIYIYLSADLLVKVLANMHFDKRLLHCICC